MPLVFECCLFSVHVGLWLVACMHMPTGRDICSAAQMGVIATTFPFIKWTVMTISSSKE